MAEPASVDELREALSYDPETGLLAWRERPRHHFRSDRDCRWWNGRFAGTPAFRSVDDDGYRYGSINGRKCRAARAIFAMIHGRWPSALIDHADRDRANDRVHNLRDASQSQNQANKTVANSTGYKGVQRMGDRFTDAKRFQARIMVAGKAIFLGLYASAEEAHAAYERAAQHYFGAFARAA